MKFQPLNTVEKVMCCPDIQLAMLLTADQEKGECDGMLQEATRFFWERKYKLRHHRDHAPRFKFESSMYLGNLSKLSNGDEEMEHDTPKSYVDTLPDAK